MEPKTEPEATIEEGALAPEDHATEDHVAEELLVEEISIDGMCGVY